MLKRPDERSGRRLQTAMCGCLRAMMPALLLVLLLPAVVLRAQTTTTVADTIHAPDGSQPSGQIVISANSTFTAADGSVVLRGTVVTVTDGAFSVALIPNTGSTPSGTSYGVIYKLAGVPYWNETWVVPSSAGPVDLADVRSAHLSGPSEMVSASQLPAAISGSAIMDKGGQVFNVKSYGATGDGTTDDTTAVNSAIAAAEAVGGVVYFPPGTYLIGGVLTIPNDGATPPHQNPLRLTGALMDGGSTGGGKTPAGGAILNLTETSNTVAKIDTRGSGYLEIDHLTLEDTGGDSVPFVHSTNTILHAHDNAFVGSKTTTNCDQDVIVLGGSTPNIDGSATAAFQGYGTVIRDNWFNKIRRAVFLAADANGVQVKNNTIWSESGSNLSGGSAIDINPNGSGLTNTGNIISGNLIELVGYAYGVALDDAASNQITDNDMFDGTAPTTSAGVHFGSNARFNSLYCGYSSGLPCRADDNGTNTTYDATGNEPNVWSQQYQFTGGEHQVQFTTGWGAELQNSQGDTAEPWLTQSSTYPFLQWTLTPNGGSRATWMSLLHTSVYDELQVGEPGGSGYIKSADKDLRLIAGGNTGGVWLGNNAGISTYFSNALAHIGTKAVFTGQVQQTAVAFASAPACNNGNEGSLQTITDSTVNTWGATIAGGGSDHVLGYCDGTNWTVAAK